MHFAVRRNLVSIVELLLSAGINVDAKDKNGDTALHLAVKDGNVNIVGSLLKQGANVFVADRFNVGPIYLPNGKELIVDTFGEYLKEDMQIYYENRLYEACVNSDMSLFKESVSKLSKERLSSTLSQKRPYTHLWHACKHGNLEMIKLLFMAGRRKTVAKLAPDGTTPYLMALLMGHERVIEYFRESGILCRYEETLYPVKPDERETLATSLTFDYPVFNEEIAGEFDFRLPRKMVKFSKLILRNLCPIDDARKKLRNERLKIMLIKEIALITGCFAKCARRK